MLMLPDYRVRQRDFLLEISRAMTAQLDLGEVLRLVLNASVVMLSGQVGMVALRTADSRYRIRATVGIDADLVPSLDHQLHEAMATIAEDAGTDAFNERLSQMAASLDDTLRQSIAMPLTIRDEPLGLLIVFRSYRGNPTPNDVQILRSFADQAAIAVQNAQLYERVEHERKRLAAILEHSADGTLILDRELNILRFNRALELMTGWRAEDAIGQHISSVFTWDKIEMRTLEEALHDGFPKSADDTLYVEGDMRRLDGMNLSIGVIYAPLFTADGRLANIIANVRDITNFRRAQEMQNLFISGVSHELKTPVAIIKGYAGTLRRDDASWDKDVINDGLHVIEDEADRLTVLIENLLTASRIQTERGIALDIGPVQLVDIAQQVVERFSLQTHIHKFRLNFQEKFPTINGDAMRLRQVLDNLVGNAIKYSPDGGKIEIGGYVDGNSVIGYVKDEGVGMTKENQDRVFERFYRIDSALSRRTQGTGLGLFLVKVIIEAHGGSIRVDSQPGEGSTFLFSLPR